MEPPLPRTAVPARLTRLALALALVALSATLSVLPAFWPARATTTPSAPERAVMGSAIAIVSLLGIVAALRPGGCNRFLRVSRVDPAVRRDASLPPGCTARGYVGHHPDCDAFHSHLVRLRGRIACAGCTGMVAGGIAGLLLSLASVLGIAPTDASTDAAMGLLGASLAVAGILGAYPRRATGWTRVLASLALVTGSVVLTLALAEQGLAAGAFGLAAALAVLGLRVDLSRLNHTVACTECVKRPAPTFEGGAGGARATER